MIDVLVVDDDYRVAAIHGAYVDKVDGFRCARTEHTAAAARAALAETPPDLVLLDLYLPDEHGLSLLASVLATTAHPDFVVVTAARDAGTVRKAIQLGAVHYLVKPFGFARLRERLESYRALRARLGALGEADQADVDALYDALRPPADLPPKGHSAPTMNLVRRALAEARDAVSAADVAAAVGVSRPTAQRYLAQLERQGVVELQLRYGTTGRPEHLYRLAPGRRSS